MTINRILKLALNLKGVIVENADFFKNRHNEVELTIYARISKKYRNRCPICGRRCNVHDYISDKTYWRCMDLGPTAVRIAAKVPRISCPNHGIHTASVPWAKHGSGFALDFAYCVAWLVKAGVSRTRVAERFRIDWKTVGRLVSHVWHELEPDPSKRLEGLEYIGIDETSYTKGHNYITVVVNHATNTVVWVAKGHGKEVLDQFFQLLSKEQREAIKAVSGDGARWITASVKEYCPNAIRCLDPFHVVEWANSALDSMRIDAWRRARDELNKHIEETKRKKYERESPEIKEMRKRVEKIKHSKYALGKNPENLTDKQQERLSMIASEDRQIERGHKLKESLRKVFKLTDPELAEEYLDKWISHAQRCRIPAFVELQRKIRRNRTSILNTIQIGLSNARIEATNNKIKLLIRIAYGFRNIDNLISFVMLFCSRIEIPWPRNHAQTPENKGSENVMPLN